MASKGPEYWVNYVEDRLKDTKDFRSIRIEKQWMINWAWYKGQHNLKYDTQRQQFTWDTKDPLQFFVNLIYSNVRAVIASITKEQPQWEVDARPYGSISEQESNTLSYFLDGEWHRMNMKSKTKDLLKYGLIFGMGIFEYGFDADDEDGMLWVNALDPFDTYVDPLTTERDLSNCRFIIKSVRKSLDEVKGNSNYSNTKDLGPDNNVAESEWKKKGMLQDYGSEAIGGERSTDSVLLKEAYIKEKDGIRIVTVADGKLLRNEAPKDTGYKEFPFVLYFADNNPGQIYSEGWVKNLVPLNRALNYIERSILEFNMLMSKGKYVTDKTSNVKIIKNRNGEIIRKSPGSMFEQLPMQPMSSTPFNQINNLREYMQDIGAAHEAFLGRTPTGVKAARAIEVLVANNLNNLADLVDNLEITLQELGEKLLALGYDRFVTSKDFKMEVQGSKFKVGKIIGGRYKGGKDVVQIPKKTEVRVRVISGTIHTKEARLDAFQKLRLQGDLDRRTLLEEAGLPVDEVELRLQEESSGMPISSDSAQAAQEREDMISADEKAQDREERMMQEQQRVAMERERLTNEALAVQNAAMLQRNVGVPPLI